MRVFLTLFLLWTLIQTAAAQVPDGVYKVTSNDISASSVTIYPDNLALITEVRRVDVPKGRSVIAFEGVSDLIIPQSMILREFTGLTLERNFDYDLMGKTALFEKSVGEVITLTRADPASGAVKTVAATIISARRDTGVVVDVEGKTEVLSCSGLSERTQFDGLPSGLNPAPVMSIAVNAETAGPQEVVISYLTSGLGWRADYRLDVNAEMNKAAMLGWLTLTNGTAKDYRNVALSVIAGDLNRRPETRAVSPPKPYLRAQCYPIGSTKRGIAQRVRQAFKRQSAYAGGVQYAPVAEAAMMMEDSVIVTANRSAKMATQENVGDYKLYRIPGATSVAPYQTKQIAFVNQADIDVTRYYKTEFYGFDAISQPQPMQAMIDIDNARDGSLGIALPKGTVRFFGTSHAGRTVYLGEDRIDNLAVDEPVRLALGTTRSVSMTASGDSRQARDGSATLGVHDVTIYNATGNPARVKIIYRDTALRGAVMVSEPAMRDADEIVPTYWATLPPEVASTLSFGVGITPQYRIDLDPLFGLMDNEPVGADDFFVERVATMIGGGDASSRLGLSDASVEDTTLSVATFIGDIARDTETDTVSANVTHALKNSGQTPKTLIIRPRYEDYDPRDISVTDASIAPIDSDQAEWRIEMEAGAQTVLRYTVEIRD